MTDAQQDQASPQSGGGNDSSRWWLIGAAVVLVAAGGYRMWQDRAASADPVAAAGDAAPAGSDLARLEAAAQAAGTDPMPWQVLATARYDAGDFAGAARDFARAAELAPDTAGIWSALGEARVMASRDDPMPADALAAFRRAAELDAGDPRARYFLAVKRDIDGDHQGAIADWLALLADTPPGAPWEADLRRTITEVGKINNIPVADRLAGVRQRALTPDEMPVAARAIPGPSRADMDAAARLPQGQQDAMVAGMVSGLEDKLKADPANVDGWIMLMRSRMTLGESAKAAKALNDAVAANPAAATRLRAQAQLLGVPGA